MLWPLAAPRSSRPNTGWADRTGPAHRRRPGRVAGTGRQAAPQPRRPALPAARQDAGGHRSARRPRRPPRPRRVHRPHRRHRHRRGPPPHPHRPAPEPPRRRQPIRRVGHLATLRKSMCLAVDPDLLITVRVVPLGTSFRATRRHPHRRRPRQGHRRGHPLAGDPQADRRRDVRGAAVRVGRSGFAGPGRQHRPHPGSTDQPRRYRRLDPRDQERARHHHPSDRHA